MREGRNIGEALIHATVIILGLWSLVSSVCVLLGGNLYHLMAGFAFALVATGFAHRRIGGGVVSAGRRGKPSLPPPVIWAACIVSMLLAWGLRGPSPDDAIYLNLAVTAADNPGAALGSLDGLFGLSSPSEMLRPYALHSIELAAAALHTLTGIRPIVFMHACLPLVAGLMVALVQFELLRRLFPSHAQAAAIGALGFLLVVADGWQAHGSHAFESFALGRGLMVNALLPVVFMATVQVQRDPGIRSGLFLTLAALAAVGASSNALALVPLCVVLTHVGAAGRSAFRTRSSAITLGAVLPVLILAAWAYGYRSPLHPPAPVDGAIAMREVLERAFGNRWLMVATWIAVASGLRAMVPGPYRRALIFTTVTLAILTFNPWIPGFLNHLVQRAGMLPRIWLLVPVPAVAAIGMIRLTELVRVPPRWVGTAAVALVVLLFAALPGRSPLARALDADWSRVVNAHPKGYALANRIEKVTEAEDLVLCSSWDSIWIPTIQGHPKLVYSRSLYEGYLADQLGTTEAVRRRELAAFVEGDPRYDRSHFSCESFDGIDLIVTNGRATEAKALLRDCGWEPLGAKGLGRMWTRSPGRSR
jgi:hypothetical protein